MDDLEKALIKLEELRNNCFPFQIHARDLVLAIIEHVADAQEKLDGENTSERPKAA